MAKRKTYFVLLTLIFVFFYGCEKNELYYDNTPPSPPRNVRTVTGDNRVDIYWDASPQSDVAGYNIYVSDSYDGEYSLIGSTEGTYYIDYGARNGVTYYYAVTAYDFNGNESDLSEDVAYDTPRPEGYNQSVFDYHNFPDLAGYSFSDFSTVAFDDDACDFFFDNDSGVYYLDVWSDTDIQDMGATEDIYDISQAPLGGWVSLQEGDNIKYVRAIEGHTYVIWTWDNHFAKIRISLVTPQRIIFDWAYQTVEGNPELKTKHISHRNLPAKVVKK